MRNDLLAYPLLLLIHILSPMNQPINNNGQIIVCRLVHWTHYRNYMNE
jgi:hypothetical protein